MVRGFNVYTVYYDDGVGGLVAILSVCGAITDLVRLMRWRLGWKDNIDDEEILVFTRGD
jgi:hypothetical protein